jgi:asparagine synthase (glutamine-hydrolysing)
MCGLAGFLSLDRSAAAEDYSRIAAAMGQTLTHRGPDDAGVWCDGERGIALAHQRLSVVDLSNAGRQPMRSRSGRYVLVYNGEIYNHRELRRTLESQGAVFRGTSDTEVLLEAVEQWGLLESVSQANGMFALALWDGAERTLTLARDRLGIKPLYYGWQGSGFLFASELKALRAHPSFQADVDRAALALFLQHSYVPAPFSIYRGIRKLMPGTLLTVSRNTAPEGSSPRPYWCLRDVVERGSELGFRGTDVEAVDALEQHMRDAVGRRMMADVPLGAFLSGGIDSSSVVALMQAQSSLPVKTFSIGFAESEYDEAPAARAVATHLGTEHVEHYVTPAEALQVVPRLPHIYDEPFADSSQIPTVLLSQITRQHVTVSLSGDGGDEWLGGYERYHRIQTLWKNIRWIPRGFRRLVGHGLQHTVPRETGGRVASKLRTLSRFLDCADVRQLYTRFHTHWKDPESLVAGSLLPTTIFTDCDGWAGRPDFVEELMYVDAMTYLPDDILVKVDRASMAVSLEARVPLLDHPLVEFLWTLPAQLKVRSGNGKWVLRELLDRYVPRRLVERPKRGFGVPLDRWLRGPLRPWAEELLSESRLREEGFFDPQPIRHLWQQHQNGTADWHYYLWDILMFQAWWEHSRTTDTTRGCR